MYSLIYYGVGLALLTILISQCRWRALNRQTARRPHSEVVFLGCVGLTLAFLRLPSLCFNQEMNPDESQLIASGITLLTDPVYGRSVDGTTIGPLNSYLLLVPHGLGLPMDYRSARLVALVLIGGSLLLFYGSTRRIAGPLASRISTLFSVLFFAWTSHYDFLHFSSELTSMVLVAGCFLIVLRVLQTKATVPSGCFDAGVLAGLVPYSKLQALPIAGMILLTLMAYVIWHYRFRSIGLLMVCGVGFALPTLVVFGLAYCFNVSDYFINFYFVSNLVTYKQLYTAMPLVQQGFWQKLTAFPHFLGQHTDFLCFIVVPGVLLGVGGLLSPWKKAWLLRLTQSLNWPVGLAIFTVVGACWAVVMPGTEFGHHLLLLVFPIGWVTALGLDRLLTDRAGQRLGVRLPALLGVVCLGNLLLTDSVLQAYGHLLSAQLGEQKRLSMRGLLRATESLDLKELNPCLAAFPNRTRVPVSPVARVIEQYTAPSDRLAVWGWHCSYYVETQLAQGVSEAHTQRSIIPNQLQAMYLKRYARELLDNRPAVFLDAVGRNSLFLDQPGQRCEFYGEIKTIIRDKYTFVADVQDVRIYVRNTSLTDGRQIHLPTVQ